MFINKISNVPKYLFLAQMSKNALSKSISCLLTSSTAIQPLRQSHLKLVTPCLIQYRAKVTNTKSIRKQGRMGTPRRKPLTFDYSGDLVTRTSLPDSDTVHRFQCLEGLENAPEHVKKLCSIEYASGMEVKQHRIDEINDRIQLLFGTNSKREERIAKLTVDIRNLIPHCLQFKKDKRSKSILVEKIQARKKYLKILRKDDYERFQWLIDELQIQYIPPPAYYRYVSKKNQRKIDVKQAAYALRQSKIDALKEKLIEEKSDFLKYKEQVLDDIERDINNYQLDEDKLKSSLIKEREKSSKWVVWRDDLLPQ